MKIGDYNKKQMNKQIIDLFSEIYPNHPEFGGRMTYEKSADKHIATKVAVFNNKIVAQANIFLLSKGSEIGNLGYHVHPKFVRQGIGEKISREVINEAKKRGVKLLVVRTEITNLPSIALARKLGFIEPPKEFIEKNWKYLQSKDFKDLIYLYRLI